jgi:hypothetical protein
MELRHCGVLKFFKIQGMRAQLRLLEYLVHMWDVNEQTFHVGAHTLTLDIDDIYFLMGLSRRILLGRRGGGEPIDYYVVHHCVPGTEKHSGKMAIRDVQDLPLWTILYTITQMPGSATPHMSLQRHFQYAIECMDPRVFNWYKGVLKNMKNKSTKCRNGWLKIFGYVSILVSLFLERVPFLRLWVEWGILAPQYPHMKIWVKLMARHCVVPIVKHDKVFFQWMRNQLIMVEEYAYAWTKFHGDLDLSLPEGLSWET